MLQVNRQDQITFLRSEAIGRIPRVIHAFSTRRSDRNDFSLGMSSSPNPLVETNRARFLAAMGAVGWPILKLKQTHSRTIVRMTGTSSASEPIDGDAAVTDLKGVLVGIQTADCAPILVADIQARAVAAIHAGWRGTAAGIAGETITNLRRDFSIDPRDLVASIGPHIGVCCYEVGSDVVKAVGDDAMFEHRKDWGKPHLRLAEANRRQLMSEGVPEEQIDVSSLCTRCREDLFHSYRRDGKRMGHMLSVIGLIP